MMRSRPSWYGGGGGPPSPGVVCAVRGVWSIQSTRDGTMILYVVVSQEQLACPVWRGAAGIRHEQDSLSSLTHQQDIKIIGIGVAQACQRDDYFADGT